MKLILVRHGQTQANLAQEFVGWSQSSLTDQGYYQARQVALGIQTPPDRIVASDLDRTLTTAQVVCSTNQWSHIPVETMSEFREIHFGSWEGQTAHQIQSQDPIQWQAYLDHPLGFTFPQGESLQMVKARVQRGLRTLDQELGHQAVVLLVSHLGVLRVIQDWLAPEVGYSFWNYTFPQGTFKVLDLANRHGEF